MARKTIHISAKAVVVGPHQKRLAIRRSASSKNHAGFWDLPGGKSDPGETVDQTLLREALEETGLKITIGRVIGATEAVVQDKTIAYLLFEAFSDSQDVILSEEHDAFRWLSPIELAGEQFVPQFIECLQIYARNAGSGE